MTKRFSLAGPAARAVITALACLGVACSDADITDGLPLEDDVPPRAKRNDTGGTGEQAGGSSPTQQGGPTTGGPFDGPSDAGTGDAASIDGGAAVPPPAPIASCKLDTHTIYLAGGRKLESITAYGKYWSREVKADGSAIEGGGFPRAVVSDAKFAAGPCRDLSSCKLDTRVVWYDTGTKIESTTAYGRAWQWIFDSQGAPIDPGGPGTVASSVAAWAAGPCAPAGGGTCTFSTRVIDTTTGGKVEIITAYGKWYEFTLANGGRTPRPTFGIPIESIPRLAVGACATQAAGSCVLDTRTVYVDLDGTRIEEVTARNRLWRYRLSASDGVTAVLVDGAPIVSTPRLAGPCAHAAI